ncbi:hypothetical protein DFJ73DRAFT_152999 [Zopfochytrium polystomum]|nr:hypothetical protein DFJ73DRAFT_152999 [Zopfochytrium polystomum]
MSEHGRTAVPSVSSGDGVPASAENADHSATSSRSEPATFDRSHLSPSETSAAFAASPNGVSAGPGLKKLVFSIEELIEIVTDPAWSTPDFVHTFLIFYRKFMQPTQLLDRFLDVFDTYNDEEVMPNVVLGENRKSTMDRPFAEPNLRIIHPNLPYSYRMEY